MRLTIAEILIGNLRGGFQKSFPAYRTPEQAYKELKHYTGQDFGYDVEAWEKWFSETDRPMPNRYEPFPDDEEN